MRNSRHGLESLQRFGPMAWLLSQEDVRFFRDQRQVAARFRRSRYKVFLAYLRELNGEIAAFNQDSLRLISLGAWDLAAHLCRRRAILLYHEARLLQAALCYRWLPANSPHADVTPIVRGSLAAINAALTA